MLLQKASGLLQLIPRRNAILALSRSQEKHSEFGHRDRFPLFFDWEVEKFVMIALKIPCGFLLLHDLVEGTTVIFKAQRREQEKCGGVLFLKGFACMLLLFI